MSNQKTRVAVIMGGPSKSHHDISVKTGEKILENLDHKKYDSFSVLVDKNGEWDIDPDDLKEKTDIAFIAIHGNYGEDGIIQDELEVLDIPYTGSDPQSCGLTMNKFLSLRLLSDFGFRIPHSIDLSKQEWLSSEEQVLNKVMDRVDPPWVIKPNRGSSSVDVYFSEDKESLQNNIFKLLNSHKDILVQEYIEGKEVSCGVLDHGDSSTAYPLIPTEVIPNLSHFLNHDSKYKEDGSEKITPPDLPDPLLNQIRKTANQCHEILDCCCLSKTDMVITPEGAIYILEVNTHPDMTETSLLFEGAKKMNISYQEFIDKIIQAGLKSHSHPHIL